MTQPRAKPNRLLWLSIAATIVVIVGVAVLVGTHRAAQTPRPPSAPLPIGTSRYLPPYLASAPATFGPSSAWTCSRWHYASASDQHTWVVGRLRLLRQSDDLPTATPSEVNDFSNNITVKCMTSKTDDNLALVAESIYSPSRHTR